MTASDSAQARSGLRDSAHGRVAVGLAIFLASPYGAPAWGADRQPPEVLADLPIEELAQMRITSVSRTPELLATAPSAIQVLTGEEIRRSGATLLPEALRLAPNLQVARVSSNDWSVSARGFSGLPSSFGSFSNNLLVMIDQRPVYTTVFGGVFWDVNNVLLEDIERIEVVSGPGATLWGANAVNGVIHVIRKPASATQGLYAGAAAGEEVEDYALRYGDRLGDIGHYRVYAQRLQRDPFAPDASDDWLMHQMGYRVDLDVSPADDLILQGDFYDGVEGPGELRRNGQNIVARWDRNLGDRSRLQVLGSVEHRTHALEQVVSEAETYYLDLQHTSSPRENLTLVWGGNYRFGRDRVHDVLDVTLEPPEGRLDYFNVFVQGEYALVPDKLRLMLGTKLGDNAYSGWDLQPTVRLAYTPRAGQTVWAAISRAVRTPSRFDTGISGTIFQGDPDFQAEKLVSYELGYRLQAQGGNQLSISAYYSTFDDLRSFNSDPDSPTAILLGNDLEANTWGVELFGVLQLADWWRLRGFYTWFDGDFMPGPATIPGTQRLDAIDPEHQLTLHSMLDLPGDLQFDLVARYVSELPENTFSPAVSDYVAVDARIAWHPGTWELALMGRNVTGGQVEFGPLEAQRSIFLRARMWY